MHILKNNCVFLKFPKNASSSTLNLLKKRKLVLYSSIYEHGGINEFDIYDKYIDSIFLKKKRLFEKIIFNYFIRNKFNFFTIIRHPLNYYASLYSHLLRKNINWSKDRKYSRIHPWQFFWDNKSKISNFESMINLLKKYYPKGYIYEMFEDFAPYHKVKYFKLESLPIEIDNYTYEGFLSDFKNYIFGSKNETVSISTNLKKIIIDYEHEFISRHYES